MQTLCSLPWCAALLFMVMGCSGGGGAELSPTKANVVFFGDSLTDGYTLGEAKAYPAHIQTKIDGEGLPFTVVNAGRSGDTTADALPRLAGALEGDVALVFVALGTNDVRKRFEIDAIRARFVTIVAECRRLAPGATIALGGVDAFSGAPPAYIEAFKSMLSDFAAENDLPYLPGPLAGVHGVAELNLPDGLPPNEAGHRAVAENVWRFLLPLLLAR